MINGFTIEIINSTDVQKELTLFKEAVLPEGLTIHVINNAELDYMALLNMAITKGFIGSGIQINKDSITSLTVYKKGNEETVLFNKMPIITDMEITINGSSNYISLIVPASSTTVLQLLPIL